MNTSTLMYCFFSRERVAPKKFKKFSEAAQKLFKKVSGFLSVVIPLCFDQF